MRFATVPTPIIWTTSPTLLLMDETVTEPPPEPILMVFPTPYADPPSTIDTAAIVPAALTVTFAVAPLPVIPAPTRGTLYNMLEIPEPYPDPGNKILKPVMVFKLWSDEVNTVESPEDIDIALVIDNPTLLSFK